MSGGPSNKKYIKCLEIREAQAVKEKNFHSKKCLTVNTLPCSEENHTRGVVQISDEVDHNLYCRIWQDFLDGKVEEDNSCQGSPCLGKSSESYSLEVDDMQELNQPIIATIDLKDGESNMLHKYDSIRFYDQSLGIIVSKQTYSSITINYGLEDKRHELTLDVSVLQGLNPTNWVQEDLLEILLMRMLLRSGRNDLTVFETVWSRKILHENYSLDTIEKGIGCKIRKTLIIFPVLVERHYITLLYKERDGIGEIMEFDSMNHIHPRDKWRSLIQSLKTFISTKKQLEGKTITFNPSVRILCPRQSNSDDCSLYTLKNCQWLIENMTEDTSPEYISKSLPIYNEIYALQDRYNFLSDITSYFQGVGIDCKDETEYPVAGLDDTLMNGDVKYFLVHWESTKAIKDVSWEPMFNLNCPLLIVKFFRDNKIQFPNDVITYVEKSIGKRIFSKNEENNFYRRCKNIMKLVGSRSADVKLETIPEAILHSTLPQPRIFIKDWNNTYELIHPKQFVISEAMYVDGNLVNCFGAVLKHIWDIEYNVPFINKNKIPETINHLTGCDLIELRLFNANKIRNINKNKRARHKKYLQRNPGHQYVPTNKIDYWRIFEVNHGCLLLECSTRSNSNYDHLLVINFPKKYIYECGYEYKTFKNLEITRKECALKILANFNVADIRRVWIIGRRIDTQDRQIHPTYGDLIIEHALAIYYLRNLSM